MLLVLPLVNATMLFYQQSLTETNYYRLIKTRSLTLQATLTLGNTDTESNFRILRTYMVRSRFVEEVSFTEEYSALDIRIGLLLSPCICNLSLFKER